MEKVHIGFCDGACSRNPGPGGWGSIVQTAEGYVIERGGAETETTNNRMEITALVQTLRVLIEYAKKNPNGAKLATVYTDSRYVIDGITKWIYGWKRNGWKTSTGGDVSNRELWELLSAAWAEAKTVLTVRLEYVAGHAGIVGNERADEIAVAYTEVAKIFPQPKEVALFNGPALDYPRDITNISPGRVLTSKKKSTGGKAMGYLSVLEGKAIRHRSWGACEKRVKGTRALFRKYTSEAEEKQILASWGVFAPDVKDE